MSEEIRKAILELMTKNSSKGKKKIYPKDLATALSDQFPRGEVKKVTQEMLDAGDLAYWSSGSTTYVMLKADYDELALKEEG